MYYDGGKRGYPNEGLHWATSVRLIREKLNIGYEAAKQKWASLGKPKTEQEIDMLLKPKAKKQEQPQWL